MPPLALKKVLLYYTLYDFLRTKENAEKEYGPNSWLGISFLCEVARKNILDHIYPCFGLWQYN